MSTPELRSNHFPTYDQRKLINRTPLEDDLVGPSALVKMQEEAAERPGTRSALCQDRWGRSPVN